MTFKKRVALFGGAFDPIHIGHMGTVEQVLKNFPDDVDEVWFLPCYSDAFGLKSMVEPEHRINMIKLMLRGTNYTNIRICTHEIDVKNMAGTYAVLQSLKGLFPKIDFSLIIGSDQAVNIRKWRNSRRLIRETKFFVINRRGGFIPQWAKKSPHKCVVGDTLPGLGYDHNRLISSTAIRSSYKKLSKQPITDMVERWLPVSIKNYIEENNLYAPEPEKGSMWLYDNF